MSLDLGQTILQIDRAVQNLDRTRYDRRTRLAALLEAASRTSPDAAVARTRFALERPFLAAQVEDRLLGAYSPPEPTKDCCVVSVDGSHIDVDRHLPVPCYLINLGGCALTYGSRPDARLFSHPSLHTEPADLYLSDPARSNDEEAVTGPLLGLARTVRELSRLVQAVKETPADLPVLALVDGSLVLWGLAGQGYKPYVRKAIIDDGLLPALDELQGLSRQRPVTLAAYVSLPRATEVVNAIRRCLCPHDVGYCKESCGHRCSTHSPCDMANDFLDRELFQELLDPGWRSPVYRTNSSIPRESYGEHQVYFYYLHCGEEIARVEIPQWVARD